MRIDSITFLIGGELKSSPSIKEIKGFCSNALDIKRGDLFFAKDKNSIEDAVKNGAYAIIFEGPVQITDSEIAWIKVNSLEDAALKLLRFFLIQNQTPIIKLSPTEYDLAKSLTNSEEILFFGDEFIKNFINFNKNKPKLVLINSYKISKKLALDLYELNIKENIKIIKEYIFETSFIFKNIYYERVHISSLFIKELNRVLNIFEEFNILYNLKNIEKFSHFKPIFVDKDFNALEFGKSDKVLIVENDYNLLENEKKFLERRAKWAKKIYISDKKIDDFIFINRFDKIDEILYNLAFNFALICVKDFNIENLKKEKIYKSLF